MSGVDALADKLELKYDTPVGRLIEAAGFEPSGGEAQKIALARAFYKDAGIVILDEPSSALDAAAEDAVFKSFRELCADRTGVIISHRLSIVSLADKIAMLENGAIIEFGAHGELMRLNGRYAELYRLQAEAYTGGADKGE
jgi:ATP-binding cassette subfamily B protein